MDAELLALVDRDRLAGFVGEHAPLDGPVELAVLSGGSSNITYLLRSGRHDYVVRRRPIGTVPAGAHDMAREHKVLTALHGGPVPVPAVFGFCPDETVLGAPFYVMSRVRGDVFHRREDVAALSPDQAGQLSRAVVDVLDRLHRVDVDAVGLGDLGRPRGFVARRIARWLDQWRRGPRREREHPLVEQLGARLTAAVPAHTDATLIHGDYRLGNLLVTVGEPVHVAAVLDWEMSTLGDPLTDLAHLLVYWEPTRGRQTHASQEIAGHPGFLTGSELAERYAATSGRGLDDLGFYLAFEHWRAAIIKTAIVERRQAAGDGDATGAPEGLEELGESIGRHLEEAADLLRTCLPGGRHPIGDRMATTPDEQLTDVLGRMRRFVDDEVIPAETVLREGNLEALGEMERLKAEAKRRGLWALGHPASMGGGDLGFLALTHLNAVIGRSFFGQSAVGTWSMQDSIMLDLYATDEQKQRWLVPLVAGEIRSSIGMTEPEVPGSDPTTMQATAELDGDEWIVNAHKWFTTGANIAAFTTVLAVTEPEAVGSHRRHSAILVPTDSPGYEVVRVLSTMGGTLGAHCEIRLRDVRVPAENLLGGRGEGFALAQRRLGPGRIFHCMRWLGQMERAFELMCGRADERVVRGEPLAANGQIQYLIAESAADIFSHRAATLAAAEAVDRGAEGRVEISLVKLRGAQLLHDVIDRAIQVHGALGVTSDTPLEWMYREARYARIYDGPDEVHRAVVARKLVKDPSLAPWRTP